MEIKLKWKVDPEPTGRYRSFDKRGWPTATFSGTDHVAAQVLCGDAYSSDSAKSGDHKELAITIADYSSNDGKWQNRRLARRFKTLAEAKEGAKLFYEQNPTFLPKEFRMSSDEKEVERILLLMKEKKIQEKFEEEVKRILKRGVFNPYDAPVNVIFGVALENVADEMIGNYKSKPEYKNLTRR